MGLRAAILKAKAPLSKWGLPEYFGLIVLWGALSGGLVAVGWGWWSVVSLPLFLVTIYLSCVVVVFFNSPGISGNSKYLVYVPYRGFPVIVAWRSISEVKYVWEQSTHPITNLPEIIGGWQIVANRKHILIPDLAGDGKVLNELLVTHLGNYSCDREALERNAWAQQHGATVCWRAVA